MVNDLTVKYYTKHGCGAENANKNYLWQIYKNRKLLRTTSDTTVMDFYFVTLDGRTSQSCHYCDVETYVKCLDVSHSEFNLSSINTDEALFMENQTSWSGGRIMA